MFGLGHWELIVILAIVVLLFGAKKLPMLGGAIGESIKNFKKGIKDPGGEESDKLTEKSDSEKVESDKKD